MDKITISLNRDSVCMGDDCNDHRESVTINSNIKLSEFIKSLISYVPKMKSVVWSIISNTHPIGYIITDDQGSAVVEVCGDDQPISNCNIEKVLCVYFCQSRFTYRDGATGNVIDKYPECTTLLGKVKKLYENSGKKK